MRKPSCCVSHQAQHKPRRMLEASNLGFRGERDCTVIKGANLQHTQSRISRNAAHIIDPRFCLSLMKLYREKTCLLPKTKTQISCASAQADQRLCISLNMAVLKSEISSHLPSSMALQSGLCLTLSETLKISFLG